MYKGFILSYIRKKCKRIHTYMEKCPLKKVGAKTRGGGLGSRPKKMYGERLGDGVEYHLMSPTPRR